MKKIYLLVLLALSFAWAHKAKAQVTVSGQIRTRSELRDGQGTLLTEGAKPALFTSQRTRLNVGFSGYRFKVYTSLQDVRVWGQDASSVNRNTTDPYDGFMVHEAWAEISLVDTGKVNKDFTFKIGRQELVYDDVRLLGNLDWLQQARRHDAALIRFNHNGWTVHLGAAYNQNAERKSSTAYNGIPIGYAASTNGMNTMYKSLEFFYLAKKFSSSTLSFLTVKDDFSKFHFDPADVDQKIPIYEERSWHRYTTGFNFAGTTWKKIGVTMSAFYQGGHYREGTSLNEYLLSASAQIPFAKKVSAGPGADITSGNNGSDPSKKYQRFDPLYGTPHKFWGYMDYFYVADGFGSNGLVDVYLKSKWKLKENFTLMLDAHRFSLPNAVPDESGTPMRKTLAHEFDFIFNYTMTRSITIEGGYCTLFATSTLVSSKVKNVTNADTSANWAYLMISIKPEALLKSN